MLGGTQSLHTNSYDEALTLPSEQSVEIALRTQQIIAHESGVADTVDPLGGAWFIEDLTDKIEAGAMDVHREDRRPWAGCAGDRARLSAGRDPAAGLRVAKERRDR